MRNRADLPTPRIIFEAHQSLEELAVLDAPVPARESGQVSRHRPLGRQVDPVADSIIRVVSASVIWFASPMRSPPTKRFSVNICWKLKSCSSVVKLGSRVWSRKGTLR